MKQPTVHYKSILSPTVNALAYYLFNKLSLIKIEVTITHYKTKIFHFIVDVIRNLKNESKTF